MHTFTGEVVQLNNKTLQYKSYIGAPYSMINKNAIIAVLGGGMSSEREISLKSSTNCLNALKRLGYVNAFFIDVDRNLPQILIEKKVEVAFLALHGQYGEDGIVQGVLELLKIPYTGTGILGSSIALNKLATKQILSSNNIQNAPYFMLNRENITDIEKLATNLNSTIYFLKPLCSGSSVDTYKLENINDLKNRANELILKYDKLLVEKFISGTEVTLGVLEQNNTSEPLKVLPILELRPKSKAGFYDYEAKYTPGMTDFILPAQISSQAQKKAEEVAKLVFKALYLNSYARVDMIISQNDEVFVLEVNTLPGMTDTSDLPAMAQECGIAYDKLVDMIINTASLKG